MILARILIISLLYYNTLIEIPNDKSIFIAPVKIPVLLSANFGELRIDHFHSGLDIKTQGVIGKEVVAAAAGYVYRISVTPGGFGKALYVRHPTGYSTVYAHLDKFIPEIADYVKEQQYKKKSYQVALFPSKDFFPVNQGDVIAYSGNSGSSLGPHLHYEIRKSDTEMPVNPLLFEFGKDDNIKPVIEKLVIYPVNRHSTINNQKNIKKIDVTGGNGKYQIQADEEIEISGLAGFGIKSFDLLNDSYNKCAVYSTELIIDSQTVYRYVMDGFSFSESRFINSHIDYETLLKENIYVERSFVLPNNKLSVYKDVINRGLFNFNDNETHNIEIIVKDIHNNISSLSFKVKAQQFKSQNPVVLAEDDHKLMPYNRTNKYSSENIEISIPYGALYDTIFFSYEKRSGTRGMLSDLHCIHNRLTPVHKPYSLYIKPDIILPGKESKMMIVQLGNDQKKSVLNSKWVNGYLSAEAMSFGNFYIGIDTVPPAIKANGLISGSNLTGKKEIKINISDDLSGIKSYEPLIDGNWTLFEFDQKYNQLIYTFDEERISRGTKHILTLKVADNKNNVSYFVCDFTW